MRVFTNLFYRGKYHFFFINTCNKCNFTDFIIYAIRAEYLRFFFLLKLPNCDKFICVTKILILNKKK